MNAANIELYEALKGLGVDPLRAQAASTSPIDTGLRDIEARLRAIEETMAGLRVLMRVVLSGVGTLLVIALGVFVKVMGWA